MLKCEGVFDIIPILLRVSRYRFSFFRSMKLTGKPVVWQTFVQPEFSVHKEIFSRLQSLLMASDVMGYSPFGGFLTLQQITDKQAAAQPGW
jgi:hypothetical protein